MRRGVVPRSWPGRDRRRWPKRRCDANRGPPKAAIVRFPDVTAKPISRRKAPTPPARQNVCSTSTSYIPDPAAEPLIRPLRRLRERRAPPRRRSARALAPEAGAASHDAVNMDSRSASVGGGAAALGRSSAKKSTTPPAPPPAGRRRAAPSSCSRPTAAAVGFVPPRASGRSPRSRRPPADATRRAARSPPGPAVTSPSSSWQSPTRNV